MVGISPVNSSNLSPLQNSLQKNLNKILQLQNQLATGNKINKASDNPAGLVISERLQAQFKTFTQSVENSQRSINVLNTAESALGQSSGLLTKASELAVAAQDGSLSEGEKQALQSELDGILGSLNRISSTTKFGDINLLDGSQAPTVTNVSTGISSVQVDQVNNPNNTPSQNTVQVDAVATQAALQGTVTGQTAATQISVSGSLGSAVIDIAAGTDADGVADAINAFSDQTGVEVVGGTVQSTDVGSSNFVNVEEISGTLEGVSAGFVEGTDIQGSINGVQATGSGNTLSAVGGAIDVSVAFEQGAGTGTFNFDVETNGFVTALGGVDTTVGLGIASSSTTFLGGTSGVGTLSSLVSGGDNSLLENPNNALQIIQAAQSEVSSQRANIGAFTSQTLQTNINSLESASNEIASANSQIRDTDFATSLSELVASQVKQQAQTSLLAQASNIQRNSLFTLLGA